MYTKRTMTGRLRNWTSTRTKRKYVEAQVTYGRNIVDSEMFSLGKEAEATRWVNERIEWWAETFERNNNLEPLSINRKLLRYDAEVQPE